MALRGFKNPANVGLAGKIASTMNVELVPAGRGLGQMRSAAVPVNNWGFSTPRSQWGQFVPAVQQQVPTWQTEAILRGGSVPTSSSLQLAPKPPLPINTVRAAGVKAAVGVGLVGAAALAGKAAAVASVLATGVSAISGAWQIGNWIADEYTNPEIGKSKREIAQAQARLEQAQADAKLQAQIRQGVEEGLAKQGPSEGPLQTPNPIQTPTPQEGPNTGFDSTPSPLLDGTFEPTPTWEPPLEPVTPVSEPPPILTPPGPITGIDLGLGPIVRPGETGGPTVEITPPQQPDLNTGKGGVNLNTPIYQLLTSLAGDISELKDGMGLIRQGIREEIAPVKEGVTTLVETVPVILDGTTTIIELVAPVKEGLTSLTEITKDGITTVTETTKEGLTSLTEITKDGLTAIGGQADTIIQLVTEINIPEQDNTEVIEAVAKVPGIMSDVSLAIGLLTLQAIGALGKKQDATSEQIASQKISTAVELPQQMSLASAIPQSMSLATAIPQAMSMVTAIPQQMSLASMIPQSTTLVADLSPMDRAINQARQENLELQLETGGILNQLKTTLLKCCMDLEDGLKKNHQKGIEIENEIKFEIKPNIDLSREWETEHGDVIKNIGLEQERCCDLLSRKSDRNHSKLSNVELELKNEVRKNEQRFPVVSRSGQVTCDGEDANDYSFSGFTLPALQSHLDLMLELQKLVIHKVCNIDIGGDVTGFLELTCGDESYPFSYEGRGVDGIARQSFTTLEVLKRIWNKLCTTSGSLSSEIDRNEQRFPIIARNGEIQCKDGENPEVYGFSGYTLPALQENLDVITQMMKKLVYNSCNFEIGGDIEGVVQLLCEDNSESTTISYAGRGIIGLASQLTASLELQQKIWDKLCGDISGTISLECEGQASTIPYSGRGLKGLANQLTASIEAQRKIWDKLCLTNFNLNSEISRNEQRFPILSRNGIWECKDGETPASYNFSGFSMPGLQQHLDLMLEMQKLMVKKLCNFEIGGDIEGTLQLDCNGTPGEVIPYVGRGIEGLASQLNALMLAQKRIWEKVCSQPEISGVVDATCNPENPLLIPYSGTGLLGVVAQLKATEELQRKIWEKVCNQPEITGTIDVTCVGDENPTLIPYTGTGLAGITAQLKATEELQRLIWNKVCNQPLIQGTVDVTCGEDNDQLLPYTGRGFEGLASQLSVSLEIQKRMWLILCQPEPTFGGRHDMVCQNNPVLPEFIDWSGQGLTGIHQQLLAMMWMQQKLLDESCKKNEPIVIKAHYDPHLEEFRVIKALQLSFGEEYPTQKGSLHHITIPYPKGEFVGEGELCEYSMWDWSDFEDLERLHGKVWCRLNLAGSKRYMGLYAQSEEIGTNFLRKLYAKFVDSAIAPPSQLDDDGLPLVRVSPKTKPRRNPAERVTRCVRAVVTTFDENNEPTKYAVWSPPRS
jgi:hypothetical protein